MKTRSQNAFYEHRSSSARWSFAALLDIPVLSPQKAPPKSQPMSGRVVSNRIPHVPQTVTCDGPLSQPDPSPGARSTPHLSSNSASVTARRILILSEHCREHSAGMNNPGRSCTVRSEIYNIVVFCKTLTGQPESPHHGDHELRTSPAIKINANIKHAPQK